MRSAIIYLSIRIGWSVLKWWWDKNNRQLRTQEIVELFKKISIEGDSLANQLGKEMSRQSNIPWTDIPIRGEGDKRSLDTEDKNETVRTPESESAPVVKTSIKGSGGERDG